MGLNCKPGDLARIVGVTVNRDRLLTVLDKKRCDPGEWRCKTMQPMDEYGDYLPTGKRLPAGSIVWAFDADLRPLRDSDGTDEMIRIAGLPNKERA